MKSKILLCAFALSCSVAVLAKAPAKTAKKTAKAPVKTETVEAAPVVKAPALTFTEATHDFGTIAEEGGLVTHVFEFTNTGSADLILTNVQASCGCTTPQWPKEPIAPKTKSSITVTYNPSGRPGAFVKTITVTSNTEPNSNVLTIKGDVSPKK